MLRSLHRDFFRIQGRFRVPTGSQCRSFSSSAGRFLSSSVPAVTPVENLILEHVKAVGPMSYATYMQFCLAHPTEGYYMKSSNSVFGPKGDFVTSPDISQIFGELIAIWLFSQWQGAGAPSSMRLVELGPGRGTLIDDILRTIATLTRKLAQKPTVHVHLVETSLALRDVQRSLLSDSQAELQWYDSIDHIEPSNDSFTMLVAHEFFDALPIHTLRKTEEGWKEIMVSSRLPTTESDAEGQYPRLQHVLSPQKTAVSTIFGHSSTRFQSLPVGADLEVSPTSFRLARKVGELLAKRETDSGSSPGGCGLIIDYGSDKAYGNSRRGFKDHQVVDIFHRPGECDLTANVDFAYLRESMQDLIPVYEPMSQHQFLQAMGLSARLHQLLKTCGDDEAKMDRILEGARRLIDPLNMGNEYSVMGMSTNQGSQYPFTVPSADNQNSGSS